MIYRKMNSLSSKKSKNRIKYLFFLAIFIIGAGILAFFKLKKPSVKPVENQNNSADTEIKTESIPKEQATKQIDLQPLVDDFIAKNSGNFGIKITDLSGNTLAKVNQNEQFFTASIYKLFVAFVGYQRIDDKTYSKDDPYLTGYTRWQCLDAMIRSSYSPCAEKMWNELGKDNITNEMRKFGLENTNLVGLNSTANDVVIILSKIANGEGLSTESQQAYLSSMKDQDTKFRKGLPAGFANSIVYNKVGWDEDRLWADASIIELKNGQKIVVSVFAEGASSKTIANLGSAIEKALE